MLMRVPSNDWLDQFEQYIIEEESDSELDEVDQDFTEYLWMENEEEFDKIELQRLEDEELMADCLDAMLDDELEEQLNELDKAKSEELREALSSLPMIDCNVSNSLLNPLAAEFIPQSRLIIDEVTS